MEFIFQTVTYNPYVKQDHECEFDARAFIEKQGSGELTVFSVQQGDLNGMKISVDRCCSQCNYSNNVWKDVDLSAA